MLCACVLLLGLMSNTRLDIWQIHISYVNTSIANLKRSAMCSPKWFIQKTLRALKVSKLIRCWLSKIMVTCSLVQIFSQVLCIILSCLVFFLSNLQIARCRTFELLQVKTNGESAWPWNLWVCLTQPIKAINVQLRMEKIHASYINLPMELTASRRTVCRFGFGMIIDLTLLVP